MEAAKNTTEREVKDFIKLKAVVPEDTYDFVDLLKMFANLLYAIFDRKPLSFPKREEKSSAHSTRTNRKPLSASTYAQRHLSSRFFCYRWGTTLWKKN